MSSLFGPFGGNSSSSQLGPTVYDQQQDQTISNIQSVIDLSALNTRVTAVEQKNDVQDAAIADMGNTKVGFNVYNPWKTSVDSSISTLNSQTATNTSNIALKADLTYVNNEFVPFADYNSNKITTNNLINTKLSTSTYNADKTLMASKQYVDDAIAAIPPSGGSGTIGTNLPYISTLQTEPSGVGSSLIASTSMHPNGLGKNVNLKAMLAGQYMTISTDSLNPGSLVFAPTASIRNANNHVVSAAINGNTNVNTILTDLDTRINGAVSVNGDQQIQIDNIYDAYNTLNGTVTSHISSNAAHASTSITRTPTTHLTALNVEGALQQLETKAWSLSGLGTGLTSEQEAAIVTLDNNGTTAAPRITNTNWNKLLSLNQDIGTGNNVTFNSLHLTGNFTTNGLVDGIDIAGFASDYSTVKGLFLNHVDINKIGAHEAANINISPQVVNLPADNVKTALEVITNRIDNLVLNSSNPFSLNDTNTIYNAQSDTLGAINSTTWGYMRNMQAVSTTSAPRFNNLTLSYNVGNPSSIRVESVYGGATRPTFEIINLLNSETLNFYGADNVYPILSASKTGLLLRTANVTYPEGTVNLESLRLESASNLTKINNLGARFPGGLNGTVTMAFLNQQQINNIFNMSNLLIGNTIWGYLSNLDQNISTSSIPLFRGLNLSNTSGTDLPFSISKFGTGSGRSLTYSHNTNNVAGTRTDGLKFYSKGGAQSDTDENDLSLKINSRGIIMYGTDQATETAEALTIYQAGTGYEPSTTYKTTIMRRNGSFELYGTTRADYAYPSFSIDSSGACIVNALYLRQSNGGTIQINPGSESPFEFNVGAYIKSRQVTHQIANTNRTVNTTDTIGQNSIMITPCELKNYSFLSVSNSNIQVSNFSGTTSAAVATGTFSSSIVNLAGCNDLRAWNGECLRSIVIAAASGSNDYMRAANDVVFIGSWQNSEGAQPSNYSTLIGRDNATLGKTGTTVVGVVSKIYNSGYSSSVGYGNNIIGKGYTINDVTSDSSYTRNNVVGYANTIGSGDTSNGILQVRDCTIIGNLNEAAYINSNAFNTTDSESGIGINVHGHNNKVHGANSLIFGNNNDCRPVSAPGRAMVFGSNFDFSTEGWDYQNTENIPVNNRLYLGDPYGGTNCSITFSKTLPTVDAFASNYTVYLQTTRGVTNGAYTLCTATSSQRYKCDIEDLDYTDEQLSSLRPVKYNRYDSDGVPLPGNRREVGFIAEELSTNFPQVVVLDNQGRPDSINYDRICVLQQVQIRKQEQKIKDLTDELNTLKEKLLRLTIRLGF